MEGAGSPDPPAPPLSLPSRRTTQGVLTPGNPRCLPTDHPKTGEAQEATVLS